MPRCLPAFLLITLALLVACGPPKDALKDAPVPADAAPVPLVPLAPILKATAELQTAPDPTAPELARADALRARAAAAQAFDPAAGL